MGAIRLFLALVVAFDHLRSSLLIPAHHDIWAGYALGLNAGYAVMFFYIISGFLMSMVLSEKYTSDAAGTRQFYWSRFIRIFSLFWPLVLLVLMLNQDCLSAFYAHSAVDKLTGLFLFGMTWRISFGNIPNFNWDAAVFPF